MILVDPQLADHEARSLLKPNPPQSTDLVLHYAKSLLLFNVQSVSNHIPTYSRI